MLGKHFHERRSKPEEKTAELADEDLESEVGILLQHHYAFVVFMEK